VRAALDGQGMVLVSVKDSGPGLPPKVMEEIFRPFFTTKPDGLGIGLSISRSIAEAHGGRVSVSSRHDSGSRFTLHLPLRS